MIQAPMMNLDVWQSLGAALASVIFLVTWSFRHHSGIMRLRRDGTMIADAGGHLVSIWWEHIWLARFSDEWRDRYGTTWAFGYGRDAMWFYTPRSK